RDLPGDLLEAALALGAHAPKRMQDPVRAVHAVEVVVDLGAEAAVRVRVGGRAGELDRAAVLDRHLPGATVGAIVRAATADDGRHPASLPHARAGRLPDRLDQDLWPGAVGRVAAGVDIGHDAIAVDHDVAAQLRHLVPPEPPHVTVQQDARRVDPDGAEVRDPV